MAAEFYRGPSGVDYIVKDGRLIPLQDPQTTEAAQPEVRAGSPKVAATGVDPPAPAEVQAAEPAMDTVPLTSRLRRLSRLPGFGIIARIRALRRK